MGVPTVPALTPTFVFTGIIYLKTGDQLEGQIMTFSRDEQSTNLGVSSNASLGVQQPEGMVYVPLHAISRVKIDPASIGSSMTAESAYADGCFHAKVRLFDGQEIYGNMSFYNASNEENVFGITDLDLVILHESADVAWLIPYLHIVYFEPVEYTI